VRELAAVFGQYIGSPDNSYYYGVSFFNDENSFLAFNVILFPNLSFTGENFDLHKELCLTFQPSLIVLHNW